MGSYFLGITEYTINTRVTAKLHEYANTLLNDIHSVLNPDEITYLSRLMSQKHIDNMLKTNYKLKVEACIMKRDMGINPENRCIARINSGAQCSRSRYTDKYSGTILEFCLSHSRSIPYGRIDQEPLIRTKKKRGRKIRDIQVVPSLDQIDMSEYSEVYEMEIASADVPAAAKVPIILSDQIIDLNPIPDENDPTTCTFLVDERLGFVYTNNVNCTIVARFHGDECLWYV